MALLNPPAPTPIGPAAATATDIPKEDIHTPAAVTASYESAERFTRRYFHHATGLHLLAASALVSAASAGSTSQNSQ